LDIFIIEKYPANISALGGASLTHASWIITSPENENCEYKPANNKINALNILFITITPQ
jgi:hypothetical protein